MQMLQERYQALDAKGSAYFFNSFLETLPPHERRIYQAPDTETQRKQGQQQHQYNAGSLGEQVMPDSTGSTEQPQDRTITAEMIKEAAARFARGRITLEEYEDLVKSFQRQLAKTSMMSP